MKKLIAKQLRYHKQWLITQGDSTLELAGLAAQLDRCVNRVLPSVANSLGMIATFHGIRGVVRLHNKDDGGHEDLAKSLCYHGWELKVSVETFFRTTGSRMGLANDTANAACLACVSEEWGEYTASALHRISRCPSATFEGYWEERRLEPFVLDLYDIRRGRRPTRVTPENEPYEPLIRGWNDPELLSAALVNACDYHCRNIDDRGQDWNPEFKQAPFDLLPCEFILVRSVRKALGLSMPEVSHPLISCLGLQNPIPRYKGDESLDRLSALMDKFGLS